ncbi:hypothetical protein TGMAS_247320 [Toxoplasma gondii MAS]|uniref:Histone RNA hairpin-binding protein RNA-binding domain-containing protein n=2 Tax=Toxoplasma gondii TaxID=5811 RepID=A0A086QU29_TOXGO|nr:hypothetical protein TGMAS_247320 [Toxoplasma gondii MAS]PUA90587.1 hypothetical protein TGBR9_247320 [Toxoplasma gondii TgCATBr9]
MGWSSRPPFRGSPPVPPSRFPDRFLDRDRNCSPCSYAAFVPPSPEGSNQQRQLRQPPLQRGQQWQALCKRSRPDDFSENLEQYGHHLHATNLPPPKRGQQHSGTRPTGHPGGQKRFLPEGFGSSVRTSREADPSRVPSCSENIHRSRHTDMRECIGHVQSDFAEQRHREGSAHRQIQRENIGVSRNPRCSRTGPQPLLSADVRQRRAEAPVYFSGSNSNNEYQGNALDMPPSFKGMNKMHETRSQSSAKESSGPQHFQRSKDKVLTPLQISKRDADILHTKRSEGYQRYVRAVPREKRSPLCRTTWHPVTPRSAQNLSVKQWRDLLSKWRHQVHLWTNLPEHVYSSISGMAVEDQMKTLGSMTARELDSRDGVHKDAGKSEDSRNVETREAIGRSSEEIASWLTALELPTGTKDKPSAVVGKSDALCRPILFVPSWYRTVLHRKKFDVVHEKDFETAAEQLAKKIRAGSHLQQQHFRSSASVMRSVYGHSCAALQTFEMEVSASQVSEDSQAKEDFQNRTNYKISRNLPLDMVLRLTRRQPDLIGKVCGKACAETLSSNEDEDGFLMRLCQRQREQAVRFIQGVLFSDFSSSQNVKGRRDSRQHSGKTCRRRFL